MKWKNRIPSLPFAGFKWRWASLQCTEGLNDPVVLLGVLFRMRKLELQGEKYSSYSFADEMRKLSEDIADSIGINLAQRTGERNLIRNSGQYWRALHLIPSESTRGRIILTDFGRSVADRKISQAEFASISIQSLCLPNPAVQNVEECRRWENAGIRFYPLRLILSIALELDNQGITVEELVRIVIPLSAVKASVEEYVECIHLFRNGGLDLSAWPNCCTGGNDVRIAREFLLFLEHYGYLVRVVADNRLHEMYTVNPILIENIRTLLAYEPGASGSLDAWLQGLVSEIDRKRVQAATRRPNQARFRKEVLAACGRCIISNVTMPEVLEAAHIKPYRYNGADLKANGFALRTDIHLLFDTGHLRISPEGKVVLSDRARYDYGASIPPSIVVPEFIDRENLRWRWENYDGL
ncbi:MAG: restriction endonuclease [Bacteroidetes bacterium]|nr:MAG: restriction endonuclease [Bacteroidota bacterium]